MMKILVLFLIVTSINAYAQYEIQGDSIPCSNLEYEYTFNSTNAGTFQWKIENGIKRDSVENRITIQWHNTTSLLDGIIILSVIPEGGGLPVHDTFNVRIYPNRSITLDNDIFSIIKTQDLQLNASSTGGKFQTHSWYKSTDSITWSIVQEINLQSFYGTISNSIELSDVNEDTCYFKLQVNSCGVMDTSDIITVIAKDYPYILNDTLVKHACYDSLTSINVEVENADLLEWYKNDDLIVDGNEFSGTSTPNLIIKKVKSTDKYYCKFYAYSDVGNIIDTSAHTTVYVHNSPVLSGEIAFSSYCPNKPLTISVDTVGISNVTYQWTIDGSIQLETSSKIIRILSNQSTIEVCALSSYGCGTSNTLTTEFIPSELEGITIQPPTQTSADTLGKATIAITTHGIVLSYVWECLTPDNSEWEQVDTSSIYPMYEIEGPVLNISNVTSRYSGYKYHCIVTGTCVSETSIPSTLIQNNQIIRVSASELEICKGTSITLTAITSIDFSYEWYKNGVLLESQSSVCTDKPSVTSNYYLLATSGDFKDSIPITVTVNPLPKIELEIKTDEVCDYEKGILIYSAIDSSNYEYEWEVSGDEAHMVEATKRYFIVDAGRYNSVITLNVRNSETSCQNSSKKTIVTKYEGQVGDEYPTWKIKGDYILLYDFKNYKQDVEWGTTDLVDFEDVFLPSDTGYHDFYPMQINNSNNLYWIQIPSESCNSRYFYGVEMTPITKSSMTSDVVVYPNPASDECYYILPSEFKSPCKVLYYNSSGSLVITNEVQASSGIIHDNISMLKPGIYFIRMIDRNGSSANYKLFVK